MEKLPHILNLAFDPEIAVKVHEMIVARGDNVIACMGISKVTATNKVEAIDDGMFVN